MDARDAWFVRRQRGASYQIVPRRPQGWLTLVAYIGATLAITPVLRPPTMVHITAWLVLIAAATILFSVVVWRTSVAIED
jgi:hypothetical protein